MTLEKYSKTAVIILIIVLFAELFSSQLFVSMTYDEPLHISAGYSKLKTGDYRMNTEHPPLMQMIESLPLLIINPKLNLEDKSWTNKNMMEFTRRFFFVENNNPQQLLQYARMLIILLTIILALFVFKWTKEMLGTKAGLLALLIFVFEPNILAHGNLTTTDLGFTAFSFIAIYCYWKFYKKPTKTNLLIAAITMSLAQLTKYTAIFLWSAYLIIALTTIKQFQTTTKKFEYPLQRDIKNQKYQHIYFHITSLIIIALISLLAINAAYFFQGTGTPIKKTMINDPHMDQKLFSPEKIFGTNKLVNFAAEKIPSILPYYYLKGLGFVIYEGRIIEPNIILGKYHERGAWHYYLATLALKTTIPFLILLILAIILPQKIKKPNNWQFLLIPAIILLTALSASAKQIGIRYILAIFPLLIIFIVSRIINARMTKTKYFIYLVMILITAHAVSSISNFPEYISYYNEIIGSENGWKYFTDTNTDWGQDFDKLAQYVKCRPDTKIAYLGTNDIKFYGLGDKIAQEKCAQEMLAISASKTNYKEFSWLKNYEPQDKIGKSILLYNITHC